jgi:mitochondrial pyruvate carrier 2
MAARRGIAFWKSLKFPTRMQNYLGQHPRVSGKVKDVVLHPAGPFTIHFWYVYPSPTSSLLLQPENLTVVFFFIEKSVYVLYRLTLFVLLMCQNARAIVESPRANQIVTDFSIPSPPFRPPPLPRYSCLYHSQYRAPTWKWGLVIAGLADLQRPADLISVPQSSALAVTGVIWSRYATQIIPVNYNLLSVNVFVGATGIYQLYRAYSHQRAQEKAAAADAQVALE